MATPKLTKFCKGCQTEKTRDDFHVSRHRSDGLVSECKECSSVARKERYRLNGEQERAQKKPQESQTQSPIDVDSSPNAIAMPKESGNRVENGSKRTEAKYTLRRMFSEQ